MADDIENMNEYIGDCQSDLDELLEYYKYRIFVPIFKKSPCVNTILAYYYEKLKLYYNSIKRKLNMTVVDSDITENHNLSDY